MIWPGGKFFFINLFLKKPNTWECAQILVVTWVKLDYIEALLSPDPTLALKVWGKKFVEDIQSYEDISTNHYPNDSYIRTYVLLLGIAKFLL